MDSKEEKEVERFVRFIKRLKEEELLGVVGFINIDPKTQEAELLKIKGNKT